MNHGFWRWLMLLCAAMPCLAAFAQAPIPAPGADNNCGRTAIVHLNSIFATHVLGPYPVISQRLGEQGKTMLRVLVGKDGAVSGVTVTQSSGFQRLDEASIATVNGWRWEPPSAECQQMGVTLPVAMDWRLNPQQMVEIHLSDKRYPPKAHDSQLGGTGVISVSVSDKNEILSTRVVISTGDAELDQGMDNVVRGMQFLHSPGTPVPFQMTLHIAFLPQN